MVRRLLQFFEHEISGLHEAAYLLGFFALLSQILGFLRDRLLAAEFGAGETLDIYYAAFRVPDFIFIMTASAVSLSVLIPFLSERRVEGRERLRGFLDALFSAFFFGMALIGLAAFVAAPYLAELLFPGFSAAALAHTTTLMRIMLLQPLFLGVSNLFASVTQLERRFFVYAVSPLLYNIGIIAGILFFYPLAGLSGLAWGVVVGAFLHLVVQVPVLVRGGLLPHLVVRVRFREVASVVALSFPRTLALSAQNIAILALTSLGSLFGSGAIAVFNLSWNLQSVPLAIVGASYSLAAFPTLAGFWSGGAREKFFETLFTAVRHILFWSFPALALFVVLRAQIVRTVLGAGAFDWADTRLTASALALFAVSVVAQSLLLLFTRAYYAAGRTRAPLLISIGGAGCTVFFAFLFAKLFASVPLFQFFLESLLRVSDIPGTAVLALPLAYSLGTIASAVALWISFSRQFAPHLVVPQQGAGGARLSAATRTAGESFSASVIMGFVAYLLLNLFDDIFNIRTTFGIFSQGLFAGLGGIGAGAIVLYLLGNVEIHEVWRTFHHKIWRARFVGPDPTDTSF